MPRQGPGDNESTRKAYSFRKVLSSNPIIIDIGCGSGMQTLELARLTEGKIIALDIYPSYLNKLKSEAKKLGFIHKIDIRNLSMFDLNFQEESIDVIWSEGAVYIYGFEKSLRDWQKFLKNKGYLVFSKPGFFKTDLPDELKNFWNREYPAIMSIEKNLETNESYNLNIVAHFNLPQSSWWKNYYLPLEENIKILRGKYKDDQNYLKKLNQISEEIELFRIFYDYYGHEFFIIQKE